MVTVDAFLHFMEEEKKYDVESVWTVKLDKGVKLKHVTENELEITKGGTGGSMRNFWKKGESGGVVMNVVFASGDSMLEFCEFVDKILV